MREMPLVIHSPDLDEIFPGRGRRCYVLIGKYRSLLGSNSYRPGVRKFWSGRLFMCLDRDTGDMFRVVLVVLEVNR